MWLTLMKTIKSANPDDIDYVKQIREFAATENAEVVVISARVEGRNF